MVRPVDHDYMDDLPSYSGAGHNDYPAEYDQENEPTMTQNLAECRVCHLLIRTEDYGTTVCDYCQQILVKRAETQERLDRIHERRYTQSR